MPDPRPTTPTTEPDLPSQQETLAHEESLASPDPEADVRRQVLQTLGSDPVVRADELLKRLGHDTPPEDWKARLWRLHNEGLVKVRWVGLADPEPVELRITARGRSMLGSGGVEAAR